MRAAHSHALWWSLGALLFNATGLRAQGAGSAAGADRNQADSAQYPLRILDRPATLPRGGSRLDATVIADRSPGSPATWLTVLGGGIGITNKLEMGGQLVPAHVRPGIAYVNPSLYATYGFNLGSVSVAPQLQTVLPLQDGDPFFVDLGATASQNFGAWGQVLMTVTYTLNVRPGIVGTMITIPLALQRQSGERFSWQIASGAGFARFDTRHDLSRHESAVNFSDLTIPLSATVTYTAGSAAPHVLADFIVQWLWPQLYARGPDEPGWAANNWALQVQTSIYFVR